MHRDAVVMSYDYWMFWVNDVVDLVDMRIDYEPRVEDDSFTSCIFSESSVHAS